MHIERIPGREREEIRQIFAAKGFEGDTLEEIVNVITSDRRNWIDTMLTEVWGLQLDGPSPVKAAVVTFAAFLLAGMVPLLPLLLVFTGTLTPGQIFLTSAVATEVTFFLTGMFRGRVVGQPILRSAVETLLVGGSAAALAYFVGALLKGMIS